jgi:hypothetical protein
VADSWAQWRCSDRHEAINRTSPDVFAGLPADLDPNFKNPCWFKVSVRPDGSVWTSLSDDELIDLGPLCLSLREGGSAACHTSISSVCPSAEPRTSITASLSTPVSEEALSPLPASYLVASGGLFSREISPSHS